MRGGRVTSREATSHQSRPWILDLHPPNITTMVAIYAFDWLCIYTWPIIKSESLPGRQLVTKARPWTLDLHQPNITTMVAIYAFDWLCIYTWPIIKAESFLGSDQALILTICPLWGSGHYHNLNLDLYFLLYFHLYTCPLFHLAILSSPSSPCCTHI